MNMMLKSQILAKGISQIQIARDLGLNDSYISKVVNNWVTPSKDLKEKLARLLDCPVSEIFKDQEDKDQLKEQNRHKHKKPFPCLAIDHDLFSSLFVCRLTRLVEPP